MIPELYDLQRRCEIVAARARRTEQAEQRLGHAAKRFAALSATLTAERAAHRETKAALKCLRKMAASMARRINGGAPCR
jgi:hypothetical protein